MNCPLCDNTGEITVPDGPDDFRKEFCSCPKGKEQEAINDKLNDVFEDEVAINLSRDEVEG